MPLLLVLLLLPLVVVALMPLILIQRYRLATETGINTNGQSNVEIRGPGVVQHFSADGILFAASRGRVERVTTTTNCMSGIRINPTSSDIRAEANVSR